MNVKSDKRLNILITNDDGIYSDGLSVLKKALSNIGRVIIIAPDRERSATGHSLTLMHPVRIDEIKKDIFITDGTPADCVNVGIMGILPVRPDIVVSGINLSANLGDDVTYSGTVAAAMEATLLKVPAFAISINGDTNLYLESAAKVAVDIIKMIERYGLPEGTFLNINVPNLPFDKIKGVAITRQGKRAYREELIKRMDPRGKVYYWIGSKGVIDIPEDGTDVKALAEDMISITPLHLDLTDYTFLEKLKTWKINIIQ
jgi:5'-nucleotidase